jgi:hypothetical protein
MWCNRFNAKQCPKLPEASLPGVWINLGAATDGADANASYIPTSFCPSEYLEEGLLGIYDAVCKLGILEWQQWIKVLPVYLNLGEMNSETEREAELRRSVPFLEEICRNPRSHLTIEEMREPIGRARRIPPRAVSVLAAHSEDWHSRGFRSIRPKCILTEVREDDWSIYENRVLCTLRIRILEILAPRLTALKQVLDAMNRSEMGSLGGHRFRINRLCRLLDEVFGGAQDRTLLNSLVEGLQAIKQRILGLEGSFLLKSIGAVWLVPSPLKPTNILREDPRYRKVLRLWHLWERPQNEKISRRDRLSRLCTAMDHFVALLCVRAMEEVLKDSASATHAHHAGVLRPGAKIALVRGWQFFWKDDGTFLLKCPQGKKILKIVAVPVELSSLPEEQVNQLFKDTGVVLQQGVSVCIVCLKSSSESPNSWSNETGDSRDAVFSTSQKVPKVFLIEVAPNLLDSTELVARVLRRVIAEQEWLELPLDAGIEKQFFAIFPELAALVPSQWTQLPDASVTQKLSDSLKLQVAKCRRIEEELAAVKNAQITGFQKKELQQQYGSAKRDYDLLKSTAEKLDSLSFKFHAAIRCPCCGNQTNLEPEGSLFSCSTDSCHTRWGRRRRADGSTFLVLMPDGEDTSVVDNPLERFGADFIG